MMAKGQSSELVALAKERGFEVHDGMTNQEIYTLLGPTPPTPEQLLYLTALVGREVPVQTFRQARVALDEFEELRNTQVLDKYDWNIGDVLRLEGAYWRIYKIHTGHHNNHKVQIELVDLEANSEGGARCVRPTARTQKRNPRTLQIRGAHKVNLATWPVQLVEYPAEDEQ